MEQLTNAEIEALLNQMEEMLRKLPDFENDEFLQHLTEFEDCYLKVYLHRMELDDSSRDQLDALNDRKDIIFKEKSEALNKLIGETPDSELTVDNKEEWFKEQHRSIDLMYLQSRFIQAQIDFLKRLYDGMKRDDVVVDPNVVVAQMQEIIENPEKYTEEEIQEAVEILEWFNN